jgi:2',3'-cyclic-nucleotide 2'-phosphodiesterase (5'-nucleotidase family)
MKFIFQFFLTFIFCSSIIAQESEQITFTILQANDFYEIAGLDHGKNGGAAKMATIRKKLLNENPNTYTVLAGDFLSPSFLGTLKTDGQRINGRHMIEVLNKTGIDLVTFGNHEFDLDENALQERINESKFDWVSSNVIHLVKDSAQLFFKKTANEQTDIPKSKIISFKNKAGKKVNIGIVAPCLPANKMKYVHYDDIFESVKTQLQFLENKVDMVISLSHLSKDDDIKMAKMFPKINLILGGHEHENMKLEIGKTIITKADANAKSVYVHRISFDPINKKFIINSNLIKLDESIVPDAEVQILVKKWKDLEGRIVRDMGFDPDEVLLTLGQPYDAREQTIRTQPAAFCEMICKSMTKATSLTVCSMMNSGSVRIDDELKDKLSQYDILRSLPFGGSIVELDMRGTLLKKILDAGWNNKGSGGFLQWDKVARNADGHWFVSGNLLETDTIYHVAMNDFLLSGRESGLEFLTAGHPDVIVSYPPRMNDPEDLRRDLRMAIIDYLKQGGR